MADEYDQVYSVTITHKGCSSYTHETMGMRRAKPAVFGSLFGRLLGLCCADMASGGDLALAEAIISWWATGGIEYVYDPQREELARDLVHIAERIKDLRLKKVELDELRRRAKEENRDGGATERRDDSQTRPGDSGGEEETPQA